MREGSAPNFCPPVNEGDIFEFEDEQGDFVQLEFLGLVIHNDRRYGFFFPISPEEPALSSGDVVLLEVTDVDSSGQPTEFERAGASIAGNLGNSKAARRKTAQVKAANAQAAIQAEMQDSEDVIVIIEDEPAEEQGSNALGDDGKPIYQQQPRNPKKGKKKRK